MTNNSISGKLKDSDEFATYAPDNDARLLPKLSEGGVIITAKPPEQPSWWMNLLSSLLPIIILVGVWFWIMNQTQGGGGRVMSFGKVRAKMTAEGQVHVNFSDVARGRRSEGRALRSGGFPEKSGPLYSDRREDPEGRAPRRPARDR